MTVAPLITPLRIATPAAFKTACISNAVSVCTPRRGLPPTGKGVLVLLRLQPPLLASLDEWISNQENSRTRPEAIRRLIEIGLTAKIKKRHNGDK